MSALTLALLRRLAWLAIAIAIGLAVGPPLFERLGWWGPTLEERVRNAEVALEIARRYGAEEAGTEFQAASEALARARKQGASGSEQRRAVRAAHEHALAAQRTALAKTASARADAQRVVREIDDGLQEIENLHARLPATIDPARSSQLTSLTKAARREGAQLWLAFEQHDYETVLRRQDDVLARLAGTRHELLAAVN